ncbi:MULTISPECIES: hypothetical protein [Nocardiopsis]|nr:MULTISPECIES: hypothetical protein [Nocardiopsis]
MDHLVDVTVLLTSEWICQRSADQLGPEQLSKAWHAHHTWRKPR